MIDAVVNTSADFQAKVNTQSVKPEVSQSVVTVTNTKSTKADEVESQANAVNDKDLVEQKIIEQEEEKTTADKEEAKKKAAMQEKEVDDLSKEITSLTRNFGLSFAQEKDINKTVVTVTDSKTDEVIRQIPSEEFLKLARRINEAKEQMNGEITSKDLQGFLVDSNI